MYYRYLYLIKKSGLGHYHQGAWVIIPTLNTESLPKYQMIHIPINEYFYS